MHRAQRDPAVSARGGGNVFLTGRIWQEARRRPLREAASLGGARAASAITVAGTGAVAGLYEAGGRRHERRDQLWSQDARGIKERRRQRPRRRDRRQRRARRVRRRMRP